MFKMFYPCEKSILRLRIEKFPSIVLTRNAVSLHLIVKFCSFICQMVAYERLQAKDNFKTLALKGLKVVAVAYERWSLARSSKYTE